MCIEPANNILIPLWKINFFTPSFTACSESEKKAKMKWIFYFVQHTIKSAILYATEIQWLTSLMWNIPHSQGLTKKGKQCQVDRCTKVSPCQNWTIYPPLHARSILQRQQKKSFSARQWEAIEKKIGELRKEMKFALLTIVDAFLWFYVATRCRKSAIYSFQNVIRCE